MNRKKILGFLLSFLLFLLLIGLIILLTYKSTIGNKNYIEKEIEDKIGYDTIAKKITTNMENYIISSGLESEALENLFTEQEMKRDITITIENLYTKEKKVIETETIEAKIKEAIEKYASNHNLKFSNELERNSLINGIKNIYLEEVSLYGTLDEVDSIRIISPYITPGIIIIGLLILNILAILIKIIKYPYIETSFVSTGIILLLMIYVINTKIDIKNLLIVTKEFSKILIETWQNISLLWIILSIFLITTPIIVQILSKNMKKIVKKA